MEAERSHSLSSTSWRSIKASYVIQSKSEGPRTRGAEGANPRPRAGEDAMKRTSLSSEAGKIKGKFLLLLSLILFRPSIGWMMPTHPHWGGQSILLVNEFIC